MFGRVTVLSAAALLVSGIALAQQQPGGAQQPQQNLSPPSATSQCWDMATNQVRNKTAAAPNAPSSNQPGNTVGAGNPSPGGATNQSPGAAANRPAGMPNC